MTTFKLIIVSTNCNQLGNFCNATLTTTSKQAIDDCSMGNPDRIQLDMSLPQKEQQKRLQQIKIR
jgi:hypothetical protein